MQQDRTHDAHLGITRCFSVTRSEVRCVKEARELHLGIEIWWVVSGPTDRCRTRASLAVHAALVQEP